MEYKYDFYWGTEPTELVVNSSVILKSHFNVLDLGCGEGRNSFFIKEKVSKLTAVDISSDALSKLIEYSNDKKIDIETFESDALEFMKKSDNYDSIYCINLLQKLNKSKTFNLINLIKEKTNNGGFNIIHSFYTECEEKKQTAISKNQYLFDKEELKSFYNDWKIIHYKEFKGKLETHNEKVHRHFNVELIAQKI